MSTTRSLETVHVTLTLERPLTSEPRHVVKHVPCCTATFVNDELSGLDFPSGTFDPTSATLDVIVEALVGPQEPSKLPAAAAAMLSEGDLERIRLSDLAHAENGYEQATLAVLDRRDLLEALDHVMGRWRPEVAAFADLMEARLREHDATKGTRGWEGSDPKWLLRRLRQEADKLERALLHRRSCACREASCPHVLFSVDSVGEEAADVANFAMMIAAVRRQLGDV